MAMIRSRSIVLAAAFTTLATLGAGSLPAQADLGAPTNTKPVTVHRSPAKVPVLVGIRTGQHSAFDRVVLDLRGRAPGYDVRYVRTVRTDGSGQVLDLRGRANLLIRLRPANAHDSSGAATYTGSHRILPGYPSLREVRFAGDFEAVVSIALGLRHKTGFRVFTLHDPTRIVVDVAH